MSDADDADAHFRPLLMREAKMACLDLSDLEAIENSICSVDGKTRMVETLCEALQYCQAGGMQYLKRISADSDPLSHRAKTILAHAETKAHAGGEVRK